MNIIETHGVEYTYPDGTRALRGVDVSIEKGMKAALVGPNGAGKSTLFLHFNGTLQPRRGRVLFKGKPIKYDEKSLMEIRRRVGMVFQDPDDQLFAPTVKQDVAFGPINLGLPRREVEERVRWALESVGMQGFENKPPHFLSGGEKKRVAIAGILAMEPEVIVLDEPTSNLDPRGSEEVMSILNRLNSEMETTIVISSHSMDLVARWAEKAFVMHEGRILGAGEPRELFKDKELLDRASLRVPTIVKVYREMEARGITPRSNPVRVPLSVPEFAGELEDKIPVRYAIADEDFQAGEEVGLLLREGLLFAVNPGNPDATARGKTLRPAKKGDDILLLSLGGEIKARIGKVWVIRIPSISEGGSEVADLKRLRRVLEDKKPERIGAMGTAAKATVRKLGIACNYDVNVIQAGIAAALKGMNVAIFASGGMAEHALRKIKESNRGIECKLV
jgi:cobalt/nickel transport system ATP-binding protein